MHQLTVHILLATYNGGRFLAEQLNSIARQTHTDWTLTVSDDGSTDDTLDIVAKFAEQVSQPVTVLIGPCLGSSTRNFFHLIQQVHFKDQSDLISFCDQDDVWLEDKLARAVAWHLNNTDKPVRLFCARTQYVSEYLHPIGLSPGIRRAPSFGNALVQNIASGNTMVMSYAVLMGQRKIHPNHSVWHDWTSYLVATALGGEVCFDDVPCLLYRQHGGNVIGSNDGLLAQIRRFKPLIEGRFKQWTDINIAATQDIDALMTPSARSLRQQFEALRVMQAPWQRFNAWRKTNIRRQTRISTLTLVFGVIVGLS